MTTYTVSSAFPVGTAGTVTFRRKEWLTSVAEGLVPPKDDVATLAGSPPAIAKVLRASNEAAVSPDFTYEVFINLTGHPEMKGTLFLTENCDLATAIQFTTPADPALFVTRAEFENLEEALGAPVSRSEFDALESVVDNVVADLDAEETARIADVNLEEAARIAADSGLDTRLDAAETAIDAAEADLIGHEIRLDTAEADINTEETARAAADTAIDGRLDDVEDGTAIGRIINTDDEGTTIFIGAASPTGQVTGDIWLDPTP